MSPRSDLDASGTAARHFMDQTRGMLGVFLSFSFLLPPFLCPSSDCGSLYVLAGEEQGRARRCPPCLALVGCAFSAEAARLLMSLVVRGMRERARERESLSQLHLPVRLSGRGARDSIRLLVRKERTPFVARKEKENQKGGWWPTETSLCWAV